MKRVPISPKQPKQWQHRLTSLILPGLGLLSGCQLPIDKSNQSNTCQFLSDNPYILQTIVARSPHSSERSELVNLITYESNHSTYARPVKTWLLEPYIPWTYYSSARSYAQSTEATWQDYIKVNGSQHNYRYSYYENTGFIQWYFNKNKQFILNNKDAYYESYFLYHDGPTGYYQNMLSRPKSLSQFARKYANSVTQSTKQLKQCKKQLAWQNQWITF